MLRQTVLAHLRDVRRRTHHGRRRTSVLGAGAARPLELNVRVVAEPRLVPIVLRGPLPWVVAIRKFGKEVALTVVWAATLVVPGEALAACVGLA